jgi:hypothetical protein
MASNVGAYNWFVVGPDGQVMKRHAPPVPPAGIRTDLGGYR